MTKAVGPMGQQPGTPDFSGYWRQIKNENMDQYLKVVLLLYEEGALNTVRRRGGCVYSRNHRSLERISNDERQAHDRPFYLPLLEALR